MDDLTPNGIESRAALELFEPGDKTALVCLETAEMQRLAIEQLGSMGFKVHTGMFLEDSVLKIRTHSYDVVLVSDRFSGSSLGDHGVLSLIERLPSTERRRQIVILAGVSLRTNDDLQAFAASVDVVVSTADISNLRPVIRRAFSRVAEFYRPHHEVLGSLNPHDGAQRNSRAAI